jgi:hypothetical protein
MRVSYVGAIGSLALVVAAGACDSRTLAVSSRSDAATKTRDGSANVDATPISQLPIGGGQCSDGYAACGKADGLRCYDLTRSQDHCGTCGNACAPGINCQAGNCQQYSCKGALSFKTLVFGSSSTASRAIAVAKALGDFDGDGILDLVGASDYGSPMSLLYGAGDGTFPARQVIEQVTDSTSPGPTLPTGWQALAADLDGDGLVDLTSSRSGESAFTVRRGSGSREAPFGEPTSYPTSTDSSGALLADFDADGRLDLVVGVSQALEYWRGQAGGRFERQGVLDSRDLSTFGPNNTLATDWNGDGVLDLVYGNGGFTGISGGIVLGAGARLHYRLGHGDGSFDPEVACAITHGIVGDLDHDNRPDLISASSLTGSTLLLGIEGCRASTVVPITDWTKQGGVALADFNGDGNLDVVIDDNLAIMVHVGDGKGGFPHAVTLPAPTAGQWNIGNFLVGDLNRDGKLDIVFAREGGWGVFLNTCQ